VFEAVGDVPRAVEAVGAEGPVGAQEADRQEAGDDAERGQQDQPQFKMLKQWEQRAQWEPKRQTGRRPEKMPSEVSRTSPSSKAGDTSLIPVTQDPLPPHPSLNLKKSKYPREQGALSLDQVDNGD
jgi:hypothetical protein